MTVLEITKSIWGLRVTPLYLKTKPLNSHGQTLGGLASLLPIHGMSEVGTRRWGRGGSRCGIKDMRALRALSDTLTNRRQA